MAGQSTEQTGSVRYFSGDNEDSKEYKRWKVWCQNKLLTLDKLPAASRGAYIYTLLSGKALEAVEHLEPETYQKEGGDTALWTLLDARFPQKEQVDELGEILGEVFSLKVKDGESMKMWSARSLEVFDRCSRKTGVQFPDQARGWIMLNRAGLSDEQKAVVIARAGGDLKKDAISAALRSCYPDYVVKKKAAAIVDEMYPVEDHDDVASLNQEFDDVQGLLEDHHGDTGSDQEAYAEEDVAGVLAATWKEKRQELNRLQRSRQFGRAKDLRRSFRVEVEEMKSKTTCHRCGKRGHWARECTLPKGSSKGAKNSGAAASTSGAAAVVEDNSEMPDFVAAVSPQLCLLDQVRQHVNRDVSVDAVNPNLVSEVALVSCPGFGVLDSGCGRTIVGADTLVEFEKLWRQRGVMVPKHQHETHQFKYGNGEVEVSKTVVPMPVSLAGKRGIIKASVVKGQAPLLISRSALKSLGASLDFGKDRLQLFEKSVPLAVNQAGQYVVDVLDGPLKSQSESFAEVMTISSSASATSPAVEVQPTEQPDPCIVPDEVIPEDKPVHVWVQEDSGVNNIPMVSREGPKWNQVVRRIIRDVDSGKVVADHSFAKNVLQKNTLHPLPANHMHVTSEFHYQGTMINPASLDRIESNQCTWKPSSKQARKLQVQASVCHEVCASAVEGKRGKIRLMEVFSPPRFAPEVKKRGFDARSYDLKTGYDLTTQKDRKLVEADLVNNSPDLLVLCPPCTHEGGWFYLNASKMDKWELLKVRAQSRSFIRWCCKLFRIQASLGGRAVFEHPAGARTWTYEEMQALLKRHVTVRLDMCRFGLQLPQSERLIRKSTRLLVTHEDMRSLELTCPGPSDPAHACHDTIQGSAPGVPSVSQFAGAYTSQFVQAVLDTVPAFQNQPIVCLVEDMVPPDQWESVCAVASASKEELVSVIKKLHQNLGHPPNHDLVRILKHGQASAEAIEIARNFECSFCKSQAKPSIPLPAQPNRVHEFNHQVGMDVKHLRGWLPNQKVKSLNIVDTASGFQRVIPFFQTETSKVLQQLLSEHWIAWAGPPKEIVLDPAQTNMGDPMILPCEMQGINVRPIAAGAHWQLGKTESHGGWFAYLLDRLIEEHQPKDRDEWLSCVHHAHTKNQYIQVHGYSPHQFVFGKGVHVPDDLLSEPLSIVPATASLTEEALAKSQAMRTSARIALAKMQDDKALRTVLLARPRRAFDFKPGDAVAYWRDQKWVRGQLMLGGRWYGPAIVIGHVGRNLIVIHRKQLLRCAPEQVRPSTTEEKQLINTPQTELIGIKHMLDNGNLQSHSFVDLVPQSYPPMPELSDAERREMGSRAQNSEPAIDAPAEAHGLDSSTESSHVNQSEPPPLVPQQSMSSPDLEHAMNEEEN
eukprot:s1627_g3.t1